MRLAIVRVYGRVLGCGVAGVTSSLGATGLDTKCLSEEEDAIVKQLKHFIQLKY